MLQEDDLGGGAFVPVGRLSLVDKVSQALRAEISERRLRQGQQLPTEAELARRFGVSRATVREAVARLKQDGLIVTRQGLGAFVCEATANPAFRFSFPDPADFADLQALIELLIAVESAATALAAERRTEAQLLRMRGYLAQMQAARNEGRSGVEADVLFHRAVTEASGNPHFRDLSDFFEARIRSFIRTAHANTSTLPDENADDVAAEHRAILDAVAVGDASAAKIAAETHLRGAAARLTQRISRARMTPSAVQTRGAGMPDGNHSRRLERRT